MAVATCLRFSLTSSGNLRCNHRTPSSIALMQSRQATLSFSDDFKGYMQKLTTFIAEMTSLSDCFFPLWPEIFDTRRTSLLKTL